MKKLLLASFYFSTGETEYSAQRLVLVDSAPSKTELEDIYEAERIFQPWFSGTFPESKLDHVMILPPITAEGVSFGSPEGSATNEDGHGANLSIDRIEQLINETRPYTDRVVLNGWAPVKTIEHFQKVGYYVNTIQDADNKDNYTVIKF
jgi:hypothetical protein